ncbi:MAG: biotin--[acetyl-CoA-carboxylase] ligase [Planctomycetota bacterium]
MQTHVKGPSRPTRSENPDRHAAVIGSLTQDLATNALPDWDVVFRRDVDSTSNLAADLVRDRLTDRKLAVVADRQLAGRGRRLRGWSSVEAGQPTGVTVTFCIRSDASPPGTMSLSAGVLVREALLSLDVDATIKWPNDLLVGDDKIGGILCEHVDSHDLVGVGINTVREADWPEGRSAIGRNRLDVLAALGRDVARWSTTPDRGWADHAASFRDGLAWVGRRVVADPDATTGTFDGVSPAGLPIIDGTCVRASSLRLTD